MTAQEYVAGATEQAAAALEKALTRLPDDKRDWSAMGNARTALHQAAECALLNGYSADVLTTHAWPADFDFGQYRSDLAALAADPTTALDLLHTNTARLAAAIRALPAAALELEVAMPWGSMTLGRIMGIALWNMSYHEGQINYIASMLGLEL